MHTSHSLVSTYLHPWQSRNPPRERCGSNPIQCLYKDKTVTSLAPMSPDPYLAVTHVLIPMIQPVHLCTCCIGLGNKDCTWNRTSLMKCTSCTAERLAASSSASVSPLRRSSTMPRNFPFSRRALPGLLRSFLEWPRCSCLQTKDTAPPSVPALFRHNHPDTH